MEHHLHLPEEVATFQKSGETSMLVCITQRARVAEDEENCEGRATASQCR